jgi:hypothetical protein
MGVKTMWVMPGNNAPEYTRPDCSICTLYSQGKVAEVTIISIDCAIPGVMNGST